ncbi:MAG: hypothetical protein JKY54_17750 [Flavobacteriales bacterium]|nr:hypothetical protein [Flavobacteriales bacterium]
MQNNDLKNWYKSSFEAIEGKPVPDVWDAVEAALPSRRGISVKRSLYVIIPLLLLLGAGALLINGHVEDYSPRTGFVSQLYITDLSDSDELVVDRFVPASHASALHSNFNQSPTQPQTNSNQPVGSLQTQPSVFTPSAVLANQVEVNSNLPNELESVDFLISPLVQLKKGKVVTPSDEYFEPKPVSTSYIGFNVGLYNVTMLNNRFFKALDKETMSSNAMFIKPSFSVLYGTKIRNNTFLELSASHTNLGQAVSSYEEGIYSKSQESLSYLSLGAGLIKYVPVTKKYSTYYGMNVEARFLLKKLGSRSDDFSSQDIAVGAKGGFKIQAAEKVSFGAGVAMNVSLINSFKGTSKIPKSFNVSRNAYMGLDLKVTYTL